MADTFFNSIIKKTLSAPTTEHFYVKLKNPNSNLNIPDELITKEFKELANFLKTYDEYLLFEQARILKQFAETKNYEGFLENYAVFKQSFMDKVISDFNVIIKVYDCCETFWEKLAFEYPDVYNDAFYNAIEMESVLNNMASVKSEVINQKEIVIQIFSDGTFNELAPLHALLNYNVKNCNMFMDHAEFCSKIIANAIKNPQIVQLFVDCVQIFFQ